ncbi:MAG: response regulator transcription factor [Ferruginibacter sp.]|nr:response regulator transcription factor [Ferruginibacter sp.]
MIRILIADDHLIVRKGFRQLLMDTFPLLYIEEVEDGEQLLKSAFAAQWDMIISDINMPVINGITALQKIREGLPDLPVLIVSMHDSAKYASHVHKVGGAGYLSKDVAATELVKAVELILAGNKYFTSINVEG